MADTKLTDLALVTPISTDLLYVVSDPGGSPISKKTTLQTVTGLIQTLITDLPVGVKDAIVATALAASIAAIVPINLASQVTGDLPLANIVPASAASRILGRGSASAGDFQELTLGNSLALTTTVLDTIQDIRTSAGPSFARLAIGSTAAIDANVSISMAEAFTGTGDSYGIKIFNTINPPSTASSCYGISVYNTTHPASTQNVTTMRGADIIATVEGSGVVTNILALDGDAELYGPVAVTQAAGVRGFVGTDGIGSITTAYAVRGIIQHYSAGTIGTSHAIHAFTSPTAGGPITTAYGVYISDHSTVNATNHWNLYSVGANSRNHFEGRVVIGTSLATAFTVGRQGLTDPAFNVTTNVSSSVTGINVVARAAAAGVSIEVTSSGSNENLLLTPKGTGGILFTGNLGRGSGALEYGIDFRPTTGVTVHKTAIFQDATAITGQTCVIIRAGAGDAIGDFLFRVENLAGSSAFNVTRDGRVSGINDWATSGWMSVGAGQVINFSGRTRFRSPSDGVLTITNDAASAFAEVQLKNTVATGYHEMAEMAAPASPATNSVRLFSQDNGAGKTQIMALFATGVAIQVAIEV